MARGYSRDLRERLLQAVTSGLSVVEVARRTGVSVSSVHRWQRTHQRGGSLAPRSSPGGPRKIGPAAEPAPRAHVAAHPDATLAEYCAFWAIAHPPVSRATMSRALVRLGLPLKKTLIAIERDDAARAAWQTEMAKVDPTTLVFLDETSTQTNLTRSRGRAPRGQRVVGAVPRNRGPNISCLAALTPRGISAPLAIEGAVDGAVFLPWLREWLLPTLAPGTTLVLDNLSVHRMAAVRQTVEAAGCHLCYLPPSSPDFNPIELVFAKLKTHLRGIAAREFDPLVEAIGGGLTRIKTTDIAGYYRHCGFALPSPATQPS